TTLFLAPPWSGIAGLLALLGTGLAVAIAATLVDAAAPRLRLVDVGRASWTAIVPCSFIIAALALIVKG
ncbi:hypothetical protein Pdsh_06675, partial [Pyrodictium delaneyi]